MKLEIEIAKTCWEKSFIWTFKQIDILNSIQKMNIEESIEDLKKYKNIVEREKNEIIKEFDKLDIYIKPVRNFKNALIKLLNSTIINYSMMRMMRPLPSVDIYEIDKINQKTLNDHIDFIKRNLEKNWIAYNQSYGRMLIKLKLNH